MPHPLRKIGVGRHSVYDESSIGVRMGHVKPVSLTSGHNSVKVDIASEMGGAVDTVLWGVEGSNLTILLTTTRSNTRSIVLTFIVINLRPELCPDVRVSAFER